jgi:hypothetical protein
MAMVITVRLIRTACFVSSSSPFTSPASTRQVRHQTEKQNLSGVDTVRLYKELSKVETRSYPESSALSPT